MSQGSLHDREQICRPAVCAYGYGRPSVRDDHVFARKFFVEESAASFPKYRPATSATLTRVL
jgi:hypothetical protein